MIECYRMGQQKLSVPIVGMTCAACVARVERALRRVPGVADVTVHLGSSQATLVLEDEVSILEIQQAVKDAGYDVPVATVRLLATRAAGAPESLQEALGFLPGVVRVEAGPKGEILVSYLEQVTSLAAIKRALREGGYQVAQAGEETALEQERRAHQEEIRRQWLNLLMAAILALFVMLGSFRDLWGLERIVPAPLANKWVLFGLTVPLMVGPARQFFVQSFKGMRQGAVDMNLLYATGIGAAFLIAVINTAWPEAGFGGEDLVFYESAAFLTLFIVLGRYLEALTRGRTSEAVRRLLELRPRRARIVREGEEVEIPADEVEVGDICLVRPGEAVPVDGVVVEGFSAVDESLVTGESVPVEKAPGDTVIGGTINRMGAFKMRATHVGSETTLAQIIRLVEEAQARRAPIQRLADWVAGHFILGVHALAIFVFLFWFFWGYGQWFQPQSRLLLGAGEMGQMGAFGFAFLMSVTVLVISCPCAVGLATPAAVMAGSGIAATNGILFRGADAVEMASRLDTVVFDKTGTLTMGRPVLTRTLALAGRGEEEVLWWASLAERRSEHPLAQAVIEAARAQNLDPPEPEMFQALPGLGVEASWQGHSVLLGNRSLMAQRQVDISPLEGEAGQLEEEGHTLLFVAVDGRALGLLAASDAIKPTSHLAIRELKAMGLRVAMLTGDNRRTATAVALRLGIDEVLAEVKPEEKARTIQQLQSQGRRVAMVGDGINDAPALAQADVGIALGSGTDIAKEAGHIILVRDDPLDVVAAVQTAHFTMRKVKQNLLWAFAYNTVAIPVAAGVLYPLTGRLVGPEVAALLMALSSLSVSLNSASMRGWRPPVRRKETEVTARPATAQEVA